jgi:hypothetical protein
MYKLASAPFAAGAGALLAAALQSASLATLRYAARQPA